MHSMKADAARLIVSMQDILAWHY